MNKIKCPSLADCVETYSTSGFKSVYDIANLIDTEWFLITGTSIDYITLYSRVSSDYWHLQFGNPSKLKSITLLHRHGDYGEYHFQNRYKDLAHAMFSIQSHDLYQKKKNHKNKDFKRNVQNLRYGII